LQLIRISVSDHPKTYFLERPAEYRNIIRVEGATICPIIRARGECSQPNFNPRPRSSEICRRRPSSELPTIRELATLLYPSP